MLNKDKLIASFEEIIGWPYESPGTNDQNGIDCSGAFVRAFRAQGGSIYHGSNRIARVHCTGMKPVTDAGQLELGMAVFKVRQDGGESADYKPGGKYYDPALVGNFYHIGLVTGVEPLRIVHATTPVAKADTSIKGTSGTPWSWAGYLADVDYAGAGGEDGGDVLRAVVRTSSGGLRMRETPSANGAYMLTVPNGTVLEVYARRDGWAQVTYKGHTGWVSEDYLVYEGGPGEAWDDVLVTRGELLRLRQALAEGLALVDVWMGVE